MLCFFKKPFPTRIITLVSSLKRIQRYSYQPKHQTTFNTNTRVEKDVTLYKYEKPIFHIALYFFSAAQFVSFVTLGNYFFKILKNNSFPVDPDSFWAKIVEKEREFSNILMPASFFTVLATFIGSWFYNFRSVRTIILHKGGRKITLVTYGLPGYNKVEIPLSNISSELPRVKAKKFIPVKVKSKPFYYLIDKDGEFSNPVLFDYTAGIKRAL